MGLLNKSKLLAAVASSLLLSQVAVSSALMAETGAVEHGKASIEAASLEEKVEQKKDADGPRLKKSFSYFWNFPFLDLMSNSLLEESSGYLLHFIFMEPASTYFHGFDVMLYNGKNRNGIGLNEVTFIGSGYVPGTIHSEGNWKFIVSPAFDVYFGAAKSIYDGSEILYGLNAGAQADLVYMLDEGWGAKLGIIYRHGLKQFPIIDENTFPARGSDRLNLSFGVFF